MGQEHTSAGFLGALTPAAAEAGKHAGELMSSALKKQENETMSLMKHLLICFVSLLLLVGCDTINTDDEHVAQLALLVGNSFVLEIDRRMSGSPDVHFPKEDLQESDYEESNDRAQYNVTFSEDGQIVTIEPGSISGIKIKDGGESILYELDKGLFAGGRFVVWTNNDIFEAELTIYGSGLPIIKSERGNLVIRQ